MPRSLIVLKAIGAVAFAGAGTWYLDDPVRAAIGYVAAAVLLVAALRDVLLPVRLAAGPDGVRVVTGLASRRTLPWPAIERIRLDRRRRFGVSSELVELDAGDDLYLFGRYQLDRPCEEVVEALTELRQAATGR